MTPLDIIRRALKSINYISRNQTPTNSENVDAFNCLNEMLASWNRENLYLWRDIRETSLTLNGRNPAKYTWGAAGDITASARPDKLDAASYLIGTGASQLERPIAVIQTFKEYQAYPLKNIQSTYPDRVWYDPTYGSLAQGTLYFLPNPTTNLAMVLYASQRFSSFATITDTISLPDGYIRAIRYNLAVELGAEFNMPVRPDIIGLAQSTKENIKSFNQQPRPIIPDPASSPNAEGGSFNILAGDYSGKLIHS